MFEFLVILYLSLAIHFGLVTTYHTPWGFAVILAVFALQGVVLRKSSTPGIFHLRWRKLLFAHLPLSLFFLHNTFWPVLPESVLWIAIAMMICLFAFYSYRNEVAQKQFGAFLVCTLPAFLVLSLKDHNALIQSASEWRFFAEEGQILGWVTKVLHGGIPYKDTLVTRGPLVIYTTVWAMKWFGQTLLTKRVWFLILNLMMAYFYYYFCAKLIRSRFLRRFAFFIILLIHNFNYRTGFGVLALALFLDSLESNRRSLAVFAGLAVAAALLSSIEVGICSGVAIGVAIIVGFVFDREKRPALAKTAANFAIGIAIVFVPLTLVLLMKGALGDVVYGSLVYPKYAMLGYASSPFPNLLEVLRKDIEQNRFLFEATLRIFILWYLPIALYLFTFFLILRNIVTRQIDFQLTQLLTIAVYGWLLFRSALGRTDFHHLYFSVPPAFVLCLYYADRYKTKAMIPVLLCLIPIAFLWQRPKDLVYPAIKDFVANFHPADSAPQDSYQIAPLRGILSDTKVRNRVESIVSAIQSQRKPGDAIYAFPNLPMYYFALDAPNPTPYEWAYQAITHDMRVHAVDLLQKAHPQFIVFSQDPKQRLDRIPPEQAVPEILTFIQSNYKRWQSYGREEIWVPKDSTLREQPRKRTPSEQPDRGEQEQDQEEQ